MIVEKELLPTLEGEWKPQNEWLPLCDCVADKVEQAISYCLQQFRSGHSV